MPGQGGVCAERGGAAGCAGRGRTRGGANPGGCVGLGRFERAATFCTIAANYDDRTVEYLRDGWENSDTPEQLVLGLRRIAEAQGMTKVAETAGLRRENLYRFLSAAGNTGLSTLVAIRGSPSWSFLCDRRPN